MSRVFGIEQVTVGLSGFYTTLREEIIHHLQDLIAKCHELDDQLVLKALRRLRALALRLKEAGLLECSEYENKSLALSVRLRQLAR